MIDVLLIVGFAAYVAFNAVIEGYTVLMGKPTISNRLQRFFSRNVQIAVLVGVIVGWLVAHFTGVAG
jgi:hypothetical protein